MTDKKINIMGTIFEILLCLIIIVLTVFQSAEIDKIEKRLTEAELKITDLYQEIANTDKGVLSIEMWRVETDEELWGVLSRLEELIEDIDRIVNPIKEI